MTRRLLGLLLSLVLCAACGLPGSGGSGNPREGSSGQPTGSIVPDPATSGPTRTATTPPEPTWGPSHADLAAARGLVAGWSPEQLAGQLLVGGYSGTSPDVPARMVRDLHLAGIRMGGGNVASASQVRATTRAVAAAVRADGRSFPAVVATDQEGGRVQHLRRAATAYPAFASAGEAVRRDPAGGPVLVREAMRAQALELRSLGLTWVLGPVADVTIGPADPTIGDRSASSDPRIAAIASAAAVAGYSDAGLVSTTKHFPGHGSVTTDSHLGLPVLTATLDQLRSRDLMPFRQAIAARAPAIMIGHLDVRAIAPGQVSTLAPPVYDLLRRELSFEGIVVTDALEMAAVVRQPDVTVRALLAGADVVLVPPDTYASHAAVVRAIREGRLPAEQARAKAARIVALQLWQQRTAGRVPVGPDPAAAARDAAARLATGRTP